MVRVAAGLQSDCKSRTVTRKLIRRMWVMSRRCPRIEDCQVFSNNYDEATSNGDDEAPTLGKLRRQVRSVKLNTLAYETIDEAVAFDTSGNEVVQRR